MTREQALELLGLRGEPDSATIRSAFRAAAFRFHPDAAGAIVSKTADFDKLRKARDLLLSLTVAPSKACKLCQGRGRVPGRLGAVICGACQGTGEQR